MADFGLAKREKKGKSMTTMCGTLPYCAPELLASTHTGVPYTSKVDVWGLGVILFIM